MKKNWSQKSMFIFAVILLAIVLVLTAYQLNKQKNKAFPQAQAIEMQPEVHVVSVSPDRYRATVTAYGSADAHYQLKLTSEVSGRVSQLSKQFENGHVVPAGTLLASIEDSDYRAALATAKTALASAKLSLLEEERSAKQAKSEWLASGMTGEPDSDLVLRKPQLAAAESTVEQAEANLTSARKNLQYTQIKVPFDAIIATRDTALGSYLQQGSDVAMLYSSDRLEIALPLSASDWTYLTEPSLAGKTANVPTTAVTLTHIETGKQWQGQLLRADQYLNAETRQRKAIVGVEKPLQQTPPLLPGTFLKATIQGREVDNLWKLPSSALSQRGEVWYVDDAQMLQKFSTKALFSDSNAIYIHVPTTLESDTQKIVVHPLSSYLPGMLVKAVEVQDE
jgi:RND family efflux transporter MFP subunit